MERSVMKQLAAFIIEDRYFDNFGKVCYDHMKHLPEGTDLYIFTSEEAKPKMKDQLIKFKLNYKFKPMRYDVPVSVNIKYMVGLEEALKDKRIKSLFNMCMFMTEPDFWKMFFDYERVMMFHIDTAILKPGIEDYLNYDYIGAPCYNFVKDQTIQNGALSIRNPRVMEYICRMHGWKTDLQDMMVVGQYSSASFFAEDIFFCLRMIKYNIGNYAPLEVSKKFACEVKYELGTLGYHAIEKYMTPEQVQEIKNQYK